ncbi:MAG: DUF362 domain-containing protein [Nitrospinae bacterium]|nr:DUF362 domain-containing protein [Nitrospinota bacterium]
MTQVSVIRADRYKYSEVYEAIRKSVGLLGGMERFVKKENRVLIKPNLLSAKPPELAVTTHPFFVKAVVNLVKEAGGIPFIGDSPALWGFKKVAKKTGIEDVAAETGATLLEFSESVTINPHTYIPHQSAVVLNGQHIGVGVNSPHIKGGEMRNGIVGGNIFKFLEIAKDLKEMDVVINLPKLKTHVQMYLTLGVKNLFGCVIGKRKAQWHFKAGVNHIFFAQMLVELYEYIRPALTIVDGITGMEGDGPSGGDIRDIGLIIAGTDAVAVDALICRILGGDDKKLYTNKVAIERKTGITDMNLIEILGERIENVAVKNFKFPSAIIDANFGSQSFINKHIRNLFISKPREDRNICTLCSFCIDACPPQIIKKGERGLDFNYDGCIRCFCCSEICPEGAMKVKHGLLNRLVTI